MSEKQTQTDLKQMRFYRFIPALAAIVNFLFFLPSYSEKIVYLSFYALLSLFLSVVALLTFYSEKVKNKFYKTIPFLTAFLGLIFLYEVYSTYFPSAYFPPLSHIASLIVEDRAIIVKSILHSLILLFSGFVTGASAGFITGVLAASSNFCRYWFMPFVRVIGPIPATAWIPVCIILFPTSFSGGVFIIAVSVWFPVTVMTVSGILNLPSSYFDAGKVLGASAFRRALFIAVPAASPTIFTGLFMGLGASFLTLIAAEMTGVKAGLGFYIVWARDYADYGRIYASLLVSIIIFFSIMTMLFKIRDRVLSWQKELIKW